MSCAGEEGTCERPVEKGGLCAGHRKRKLRGQSIAAALNERSGDPLESLFRAFLAYRDELDTKTDEEFQRGKERVRFQLREYLWSYVPKLLRKHRAQLEQPGGVEAFVASYGDKSAHGGRPRRPHHPHHKKQHLQSHPQHAVRKAKS